jgi:hypothetical protein
MRWLLSRKILLVTLLIIVTASSFVLLTHNSHVDFTTQVKPIINRSCITCHGGVRQKGGFSLLFREEALAKTESGKRGIVPGDPGSSEMIRRINLKDPEERMPYKHDPLSKEEINILTKWVKEGAPWGEHWAYAPVKEVHVPQRTSFFGFNRCCSCVIKFFFSAFFKNSCLEVFLFCCKTNCSFFPLFFGEGPGVRSHNTASVPRTGSPFSSAW